MPILLSPNQLKVLESVFRLQEAGYDEIAVYDVERDLAARGVVLEETCLGECDYEGLSYDATSVEANFIALFRLGLAEFHAHGTPSEDRRRLSLCPDSRYDPETVLREQGGWLRESTVGPRSRTSPLAAAD